MSVDNGKSHWVGDKVYDCAASNSRSTAYFLIHSRLWRIVIVVPQTMKEELVLFHDRVNCEFILRVHACMYPLPSDYSDWDEEVSCAC